LKSLAAGTLSLNIFFILDCMHIFKKGKGVDFLDYTRLQKKGISIFLTFIKFLVRKEKNFLN